MSKNDGNGNRNKMWPCNEGGQNCNNSSQRTKHIKIMLKFNNNDYFSTRDHLNVKHNSILFIFSRDFGTGIAL